MKNNRSNERFKIKVNRLASENEKLYPYNKYSKNDPSTLKKLPQKNSILYKLKFKPEIIINEYHQTSNNINTNINIKTNQSENSNINNTSLNNNNSFRTRKKNYSLNKYYADPKDNSLKSEDNDSNHNYNNYDKSFNRERNIRNKDNKSNRFNNIESNNEIFSPFSNGYSTQSREKEYKKRNVNYNKDNKYNELINNNEKKSSIYIFQSPNEYYKLNRKMQANNDSNSIENQYQSCQRNYYNHRNNSQEEKSTVKNLKYQKRKNPSYNETFFNNNINPNFSQSSIESLRTKKMKEMNDIVFSSGNRLNNIFRNRFNKRNDNLITNDNNINKKEDPLNIKLEYYRIKLFKEFFKHFKIFYTIYIGRIFYFFLKNLKNYRKYNYRNENNYIYNKKINNNSIDNTRHRKKNVLDINNKYDQDLIELFKSSTVKDYYKLYNQFKKSNNLDPDFKEIMNNYSLHKDFTDAYNKEKKKNITTTEMNNKYYLNSAPRMNKNIGNLSTRRKEQNKMLFNSNSRSPSFRIGNRTIFKNDISFGIEGNEKEKELFRDTKELNRKYEQIQRRKKKSEKKNRENLLEQNNRMNANKSADIDNIKNSDEYNEFAELRKNIQASKNYNIKKNIINIKRNNNNINNIRITSENNTNSSIEKNGNKNNEPSIYSNTFYQYNSKYNNINKNENKDINIKVNKEGRTGMLRKNKESSDYKNKFINNINVIDKKNIQVKDTINYYNTENIDDDKNYKKVKVNINKQLYSNNRENIVENKNNQTNSSNNIHKINNNYNYRIIPTNRKFNYSSNKNLYYSKNNKLISTVIKNLATKDKKIHINMFYYTHSNGGGYRKKKYYFLKKVNLYSICLLGEVNLRKNQYSKLKFKLSSIKEEEISNQTSRIYDESGTFGNINTYDNKKSGIINNQNESQYSKFIDLIENVFKKHIFKKIKYTNTKNKNNENNNNERNLTNKVYNKKNRIKNYFAPKEGNFNRIKNKKYGNYYNRRNLTYNKYEDSILNFRIKLIKYIFSFFK